MVLDHWSTRLWTINYGRPDAKFGQKFVQLDVIEPNKIRIISNRDGLPRETSFSQVTEENPDFLYVHRRSRDEKGQNIPNNRVSNYTFGAF